tara:strand:- start:104520 stop:105431 length:912 start_codon:yes stop_codon:yes gene_type:complete
MKTFIKASLLIILICSSELYAKDITVTLLGTGTPRPDINRFGPATLIEYKNKKFLFDAGRGVTMRLRQAGVELSEINQVFITHLHSDHIIGFDDLLLTGWIWQRQGSLHVYGPEGISLFIQNIKGAYSEDINFRNKHTLLEIDNLEIISHTIKTDIKIYDEDGLTITAFSVNHGIVEPSFGYLIKTSEHSVVISGDTSYSENLVHHSQGVDLLIHELAAINSHLLKQNKKLRKIAGYHTSIEEMQQVLSETAPKVTVFSHLLLLGISEEEVLNAIKNTYSKPVYMGKDLLTIKIGQNIRVIEP